MLKDVIDWQKRFDEFWRTMMDTPAKNLTETEAGEQVKHFISDLLTQLEREVEGMRKGEREKWKLWLPEIARAVGYDEAIDDILNLIKKY
jgi:hypothetical protein